MNEQMTATRASWHWCCLCAESTKDNMFDPCCRSCLPLHKQLRAQARAMFADDREYYTACERYGGNNAYYARNLAVFTRALGLRVHHNQYRHRFRKGGAPRSPGDDWVDHKVLLRDADDPEKFVLLSQPYDCRGMSNGLFAGLAPYGFGTAAVLYGCLGVHERLAQRLAAGYPLSAADDFPPHDQNLWDPDYVQMRRSHDS